MSSGVETSLITFLRVVRDRAWNRQTCRLRLDNEEYIPKDEHVRGTHFLVIQT